MHIGSERWPVPDWVLPQDCWAIVSSERIHHGVSFGSVSTYSGFQFRIPHSLGWSPQPSHRPQRRVPLLQHPPFNCSLFPTLSLFSQVKSKLLSPSSSALPTVHQLSHQDLRAQGASTWHHFLPKPAELSPQPHSQLAHQEFLSPIQYQSKRLPPLLLHPARTQPEANRRTAQICIFTFYSLQLLGHDSEQTS